MMMMMNDDDYDGDVRCRISDGDSRVPLRDEVVRRLSLCRR